MYVRKDISYKMIKNWGKYRLQNIFVEINLGCLKWSLLALINCKNHFVTHLETITKVIDKFRYYATLRVRIFESLFNKINTFLQKNYHLHWIAVRANILFKYIIYIPPPPHFGCGFCSFFSTLFPKAQLLVVKKNWHSFCCIVLLLLWAQKVCLRFLKSYFKLEKYFCPSWVFLVDIFN